MITARRALKVARAWAKQNLTADEIAVAFAGHIEDHPMNPLVRERLRKFALEELACISQCK
jgi:hypothetical protein